MSGSPFETHREFIDDLLPAMKQQARAHEAPAHEVALVVFCAMATVLQFEGWTYDDLCEAVRAAGEHVPSAKRELLQ